MGNINLKYAIYFLILFLSVKDGYPNFALYGRTREVTKINPRFLYDKNSTVSVLKLDNPDLKNNTGFHALSQLPVYTLSVNSVNENKSIFGMNIMMGTGKLRFNFYGSPQYTFDYELIKGGGVSLEIPLLLINERFSLYNELGFSTFKASARSHYSDTTGGNQENNYYDVELTFSPNTVTLSNIVRYALTPGEFKYYVALGIYNSFVISSTNQKITEHYLNGETTLYTEEAVPNPSVHGLMLLACTGFSFRNFGFELRFDPGHNYSNKLNYAVYMPTYTALLHVRINPK